jgi:hypothetical protein
MSQGRQDIIEDMLRQIEALQEFIEDNIEILRAQLRVINAMEKRRGTKNAKRNK